MIASAHFAAGIVVGLASDRVIRGRFARGAIAFTAAFVMHFLMDAVPHSDYHFFAWRTVPFIITVEALLVGVIAALLLRSRATPQWPACIAAGLLGSVLPDAKFVAPFFLSTRHAEVLTHYGNWLHRPFHNSADSALGMTSQVLAAVLLLVALAAFPRRRARES